MLAPEKIAANLRAARVAWGISAEDLAVRARVPLVELKVAEKNARVDVKTLAALSTALGGTLEDLVAGHPFWTAPAHALKTADPASVDVSIVRQRLAHVAAAARVAEGLRQFLGLPDLWAKYGERLGPVGPKGSVVKQAEELAKQVRSVLENAHEPFASVRAALARLGVAAFLADFGTDSIDGVMWHGRGERPCAAANISARGALATAIRMTFAHELCHALFDRPKRGDQGIIEARTPRGEAIEQRANAFAAYFLAPRQAVDRFLDESGLKRGNKPTRQHLFSLSLHFGMGVEAFAAHLVHCGWWTEEEMLAHRVPRSPQQPGPDDWEMRATEGEQRVPLERRGIVLDLATQALVQGRISAGRWRQLVSMDSSPYWKLLLEERNINLDIEFHAWASP